MWKNIVQPDRPQMTIWRMRIACWIPKARNMHSQCVIFIPYPLQQWLREEALLLHYTTLSVLLFCNFIYAYYGVKQGHDVAISRQHRSKTAHSLA